MQPDIRATFGKRLRALRKKRGWTQAAMAHYVGLDRTYIGDLELGKRSPGLVTLKSIADVLKISLSRLFSGLK